MKRRTVLAGLGATAAVSAFGMPSIVRAQAPISLNGAVQFNDDHAFTKALTRFGDLVQKYYGQPVNFTLHKNSSLGLEKQYFEYMAQGKAVDYGIVSPAHMSTFAKAAPFIDAPFVFKGIEHMNKIVEQISWRPLPTRSRRGPKSFWSAMRAAASATYSPTGRCGRWPTSRG